MAFPWRRKNRSSPSRGRDGIGWQCQDDGVSPRPGMSPGGNLLRLEHGMHGGAAGD